MVVMSAGAVVRSLSELGDSHQVQHHLKCIMTMVVQAGKSSYCCTSTAPVAVQHVWTHRQVQLLTKAPAALQGKMDLHATEFRPLTTPKLLNRIMDLHTAWSSS
jgi:hypothetical protein